MIDPDLSQVKAIPPHFWKRSKGNMIVPMTDAEQKIRLADIEAHGIDNVVTRLRDWKINPTIPFYVLKQTATVLFFAGSVLFCYAVVKNNPGLLASLWNTLN